MIPTNPYTVELIFYPGVIMYKYETRRDETNDGLHPVAAVVSGDDAYETV